MTKRTKTVHETASNKARRATNGPDLDQVYAHIAGKSVKDRTIYDTMSLIVRELDQQSKRLDALGEQVARVATRCADIDGQINGYPTGLVQVGSICDKVDTIMHTCSDMCIDPHGVDDLGVLRNKLNYYAWGTVMACVLALAALWVALAR